MEAALHKHSSLRKVGHGEKLGRHLEKPSPRSNATLSANPSGDQLILFGGEHFDGKTCNFFNDLFVYEIGEGNWYRVVTAICPGPRSSHQAVWGPDGKLYVFGGEFGTSKETRFLHYRDFWSLDPATWTWESLPCTAPIPPARSGHRMAVWGDFIVLYGGFMDTTGNTTYMDDLWLYSFTSRSWKKVDWMNVHTLKPSARSAFQFCPSDEGIVLYGGYCQVKGKSGVPKGQVLNDCWLLKMADASNLELIRWEKRKTGSTAPTYLYSLHRDDIYLEIY